LSLAPARVPSPRPAVRPRPRESFASIEVSDDFDAVAGAWAEIAAASRASPYQSLAFARAFSETIGAASGMTPMIVVARDTAGTVTALLPLGRFRRGPAHVATFLGDRFANYHMGLFRAGVDWRRGEIEALLRAAAAAARPRLDAFVFINQPPEWRGAPNPTATIDPRPSPSAAFATTLPGSHDEWLERFSASARKKMRKKLRKLEAIGPVSLARASGAGEVGAVLQSFLAQKRARARALGLRSEFDRTPTIALLERLAVTDALELHALRAGERIIAVFGGLADRRRLHGMILSFDIAPEVAATSPGEFLVTEVARSAIARGLEAFDLGVGEARYKSECCETTEPLFDSALAITPLGRAAAAVFLGARALKRRVKQSPRWLALALKVQRRLG
jgi:CelD/BcsL family acetyltransferase involved in cellulose biosynthesis